MNISEKDAIRLGLLKRVTPIRDTKNSVKTAPRRTAESRKEAAARSRRAPRVDMVVDDEITFFVPGEPQPKERARTHLPKAKIEQAFEAASGNVAEFNQRLNGLMHRSFTPTTTRRFEAAVGSYASLAMRSRKLFDAAVEMHIVFTFEGDESEWPTHPRDGDLDNIGKAILDSLKGVVWVDDRLVVRKTSEKVCGPRPGVEVRVRSASRNASNWENRVIKDTKLV